MLYINNYSIFSQIILFQLSSRDSFGHVGVLLHITLKFHPSE